MSVGSSVKRREGEGKLTGAAKYIDDESFPGCLFGATLRARVPHGFIRKITFDPRFPWAEFVIAQASDIPGQNVVKLIENDQPLLAEKRVMHRAEPILLVAHADRARAYEALDHIQVEYDPVEPVLSIEDSLALKQTLFGDDNVFKSFLIKKGDVEGGLAQAALIVEGEYRVPHQEQAYIENNGVAAWIEKDGTLTVQGSLQCPYYVHKALKALFKLPDDKVRVIQAVTGGGFGGKEEYPSMIAGHAALLAFKAKRPVKVIYDRPEDMEATTKRHPAVIKHRTGVSKEGKLLAQDIEVVMDGGAYATLSAVVLSRGTLHATGPYECPNVRVWSKAVATNTPPNGAFRGFGAPQTLFAAELHMERIAEKLGMDALELRRKNVFKEGSVTATGQILKGSLGASEALERCAKRARYSAKRKEYRAWNKSKKNGTWRGIGLALCHHGAGFTGSGEVYLASRAQVALTRDGRILALAGSTEIGQGTNTIFAQIVGGALGVPADWVDVERPDTSRVPDSGPTVASRTCMVVGGLLQKAAGKLKADLGAPKTRAELKKAAERICAGAAERIYEAQYEKPGHVNWDDKTYTGDAYGVYSYAAVAADLEIDRLTFEVTVRGLTTVQDIGKAINPLLAEGQIIGGTAQGLGYALLENAVFQDGAMANAQLTNYIIPTSMDTPRMDVEILEKPYAHGPFGAKGVGELPMDPPAPAVAAAVHDATGLWMCDLPILPEKLLRAHHDKVHG